MHVRHVYATEAYESMRDELADRPGFARGAIERRLFPDGERGLRLPSPVKGQHAIIIGSTGTDSGTLDIFDLAFGLTSYGVDTLSLVIPYFGYSTQERASTPGEIVTAKSRALLFSALPPARLGTELVLVDLHTPGIGYYFEGNLRSYELSAAPLILPIVKDAMAKVPCVIGCTDAGRAKWVQALANAAGIPAVFVYKARREDGGLAVTGVNAEVTGKHVLIYDDMVRTGGSLIQAARAYRDAGAVAITALATHGVLPGASLDKIATTGLFDAFYCTDSLPHIRTLAHRFQKFLRILPLAPVLANHFA